MEGQCHVKHLLDDMKSVIDLHFEFILKTVRIHYRLHVQYGAQCDLVPTFQRQRESLWPAQIYKVKTHDVQCHICS